MIRASATSSAPRQLPPAGTHVARCYQMIDLGTHDKEWKGVMKKKHEIRISWELPLETADFGKGEQPFSVSKTYTLSLSEKANLLHDLQTWRSRPFTETELESFDVATVIGAPCMVTVTHVEKNGKSYANVTAVTAMPKGMTCPVAVNPHTEFSLETHDEQVFRALPQFLQDIITSSDEWKQQGATQPDDDQIPDLEPEGASNEGEDDCPF